MDLGGLDVRHLLLVGLLVGRVDKAAECVDRRQVNAWRLRQARVFRDQVRELREPEPRLDRWDGASCWPCLDPAVWFAIVEAGECGEFSLPVRAYVAVGRHYEHLGRWLHSPEKCRDAKRLQRFPHADLVSH